MKYGLYSVRDNKIGFMIPTADISDQSAIRQFGYNINNAGVMSYEPKDFDLYKVGEFDVEKGELIPNIPEHLCSGTSVVGDK